MTLKIGYRLYTWVHVCFLNKEDPNWEKYGKNSWAVVTGGSDGIGFGFAREFARRGLNIVLVSRTESKLKEKCAEITKEFPNVKASYAVIDAVKTTSVEGYQKVFSELDKYDVSIVVNSLGGGCPGFGYEHNTKEGHTLDQPWKGMVERGEYTYDNIADKQVLDVT